MRRSLVVSAVSCLSVAVATLSVLGAGVATPSALADTPAGEQVSEVARSGTPHVLDGRVLTIAAVGDTILLGGTFTSARDHTGDTSAQRRRGLLAFDRDTGKLRTGFRPDPHGAVTTIVPAGDGTTVYVGGTFTTIGGVARQRIARVRVSDGSVVSAFNAGSVAGAVKDAALRSGRLWLAGAFTHAGGRAQKALATLDPTTGAATPYMSLRITGSHRGAGATQVLKMDITPDGRRLVAVGNFSGLDGAGRQQLFTLDLDGSSAAPGSLVTGFYAATCSAAYDTYLRDVDFSPDGRFFVVSTTGAYGGSTGPCDTVARFETAATGTDVAPSWTDYTGGDTSYAVEVTDTIVYVGGHGRWWNNPFGNNRAAEGAVAREGIAALDPTNGLPLRWNPGRAKGVGVFDFLLTDQGLWVASDTDRIGDHQYRGRIALMPTGGVAVPAQTTTVLPNDVYTVGTGGKFVKRRLAIGSAPSAATAVSSGGIAWGRVTAAFMVNGVVFHGNDDGTFDRRGFNGAEYAAATVPVDTADRVVPLASWRNDVTRATSMFFDDGRLYFTRSDSDQLFFRFFTPQSGVVGAQRFTVADPAGGLDPAQVRGAFVTPTHVYWATPTGELRRQPWTSGPRSGRPTGTGQLVSGPGVDGVTWGGQSMFLHQSYSGGPSVPPAPSAVSHAGGARATANATSHRVAVPATVRAGDALVLTLGLNRSDVAVTAPAGWTQRESVVLNGIAGRVWTRTATAADAGREVSVRLGDVAKGELTLQAYRGPDVVVTDTAASVTSTATTDHHAPDVRAATSGAWVQTQWVAKTSVELTWDPPPGTTVRATGAGAGGGHLTSLVVDTGRGVSAGAQSPAVATSSVAARALALSVVVGTP